MQNQVIVRKTSNPKLLSALVLLTRAALSKEIAGGVSGPLKGQIGKSADETIKFIIDDYCGTGKIPTTPPIPLPGPHGPALRLATALAGFANLNVQEGGLRAELMKIASDLTQKAYSRDGLS